MKKRFRPFPIGASVCGVEVLALLRNEHTAKETIYQCKYLCCGTAGEISHHELSQRVRNDSGRCALCQKLKIPASYARRARKPREQQVQFIDEMPLEERPKVPSAAEILTLYARAERAVRSRV